VAVDVSIILDFIQTGVDLGFGIANEVQEDADRTLEADRLEQRARELEALEAAQAAAAKAERAAAAAAAKANAANGAAVASSGTQLAIAGGVVLLVVAGAAALRRK